MSDKSWGGRFQEDLDAQAAAFSASVDVDKRLAPADIRGSIAHARMLGARGILAAADVERIEAGLRTSNASRPGCASSRARSSAASSLGSRNKKTCT